jgi:AcrR family transcriptional regulator
LFDREGTLPKVTEKHVARRRDQILTATYRCLRRKGFKRTTLRDICREAGLSMGAVYGHFESKEAIVVALAEAFRQQNLARGAPLAASGSSADSLCEILRRVATAPDAADSVKIDVRLWAEALDTPLLQEQIRLSYTTLLDATEGRLREGQGKGTVPETVNPRAVACVVSSLLIGLGLQRLWDHRFDTDSYLEVATSMLKGWLAIRPGGPAAPDAYR